MAPTCLARLMCSQTGTTSAASSTTRSSLNIYSITKASKHSRQVSLVSAQRRSWSGKNATLRCFGTASHVLATIHSPNMASVYLAAICAMICYRLGCQPELSLRRLLLWLFAYSDGVAGSDKPRSSAGSHVSQRDPSDSSCHGILHSRRRLCARHGGRERHCARQRHHLPWGPPLVKVKSQCPSLQDSGWPACRGKPPGELGNSISVC